MTSKQSTDAIEHAMAVSLRGAQELIIHDQWREKLQRSARSGIPLRIKLGLDPTSPNIHLGHTVVLNKLRQLQDLGHTVIFLIGDFTSLIGDPSGRNITRPSLSADEIKSNAQTYFAQAAKILHRDRVEVRYNSEWNQAMGTDGIIRLASRYTVARLLERDDFSRRYRDGIPISMHELLYPLIQGNDSVVLRADLELGGTDQKFNLLVGRDLQREVGQEPQCVLTMPILEGTDGVEKMSKSKQNYIGIDEPPDQMFGKVMSISDVLMWRYYQLLSFRGMDEIQALQTKVAQGSNPRDIKIQLALELVTRFHGAQQAQTAKAEFEQRFSRGGLPSEIESFSLSGAPMGIATALKSIGLCSSTSDALRNIAQGGVRINQQKISDPKILLDAGSHLLQVGKRRIARLELT